ncbi:MAG: hypothetical protein HUK09_08125, partial [Bacteroidaceae bacterium]|nr:hypothetical protein [Bacteroidaceae bacterium]
VRMTSSNGDTFRNSVIDTQITATQMYGHHDLTPYIPERGYTWTRISRQPELDTVWNERHRNHGRTIRVTAEDVYLRAVFECEPDTSGITDEILAKIISTPQ